MENEAVEQVAFADRLLLNKTDLVSQKDLERVEKRLRAINSNAPVIRCTRSNVSVDNVLNIYGFDLKHTLDMDPEFLNTDGASARRQRKECLDRRRREFGHGTSSRVDW